ncbi:hypothetical protein [Bacillus sp. FJAT-27245]|uniref:hypothetical protein n=1 Tax=Bacillus sp. FJAT-27245 TaxID=1684144 RepID=UPI000B177705|nr:hypothetical protein [Bacillus sp. FJAT-27245]
MSRYTCKDFRRDHRFFCNEFAPILATVESDHKCECGHPIANREFSKCCRKKHHEHDHHCGHRHHHHHCG